MLPKVHIIIPTFERLEMFKLCLDSVLSQSYKNIIITIYDNSYSNKIKNYIKIFCDKYQNLEYERNYMNLGAEANHRKCFRNIKGDFFYILTSDVLLTKYTIEKMVKITQETRDLPFVFGNCADQLMNGETFNENQEFKKNNLISKGTGIYSTDDFLKYYLLKSKVSNNISLYENLINTQMYQNSEIGLPIYGFNEEESRLAILMLLHNEKLGYIDEILKLNLIDRECKITSPGRKGSAYRDYYILWSIENILNDHKRRLIHRDVNLFPIKIRLIRGYFKCLCYFDMISLYSANNLILLILDICSNLLINFIFLPLKIIFHLFKLLIRILIFFKRKFKLSS